MSRFLFTLAAFVFFVSCSKNLVIISEKPAPASGATVILANEYLLAEHHALIENKRLALLTNPSGVNRQLELTADILCRDTTLNLVALLSPEHGIRGKAEAGESVESGIDSATGLPVYSLYGKNRKPSQELMDQIDLILIDIQDVGIRAYTYIYTMALIMESAAEYGKEVLVLDRPNPLGGLKIEGNILNRKFSSFVGMYPIPYRHGLTIGELALLFNKEFDIGCRLTVLPMKNYHRSMFWADTGLPWVPTSPHVPHAETCFFLGATGTIGELSFISEGVGYTSPFEFVAAPWIDGLKLSKALNSLNLPGVIFRPVFFKPYYGSFKGFDCAGVQLHISSYTDFNAYNTGLHILSVLTRIYTERLNSLQTERVQMFSKVVGDDRILEAIRAGQSIDQIERDWQKELQEFIKIRNNYLIYH